MNLTKIGKALVVTLLFRLLFGGYLIGMDQYRFNDVESALTVLLIYGLIGIFATLFISGIRYGLLGLIGLDSIFITLQIAFTILSLSKIVDPGLHDPLVNWWATMLMCLFSLLTLIFSLSANREINISQAHNIKSTINS
jgi:putative exporter of polyketide antibiotics